MSSHQWFRNHSKIGRIYDGDLWTKAKWRQIKINRIQRYPCNGDRQRSETISKRWCRKQAQRVDHIHWLSVPFESHTVYAYDVSSFGNARIHVTGRVHQSRRQYVSQRSADLDGYVRRANGQTVLEESKRGNGRVSVPMERFQKAGYE